MLQHVLPSLIATIAGLLLFYFFKKRDADFKKRDADFLKRSGIIFSYELLYVMLIFLPVVHTILAIPGSNMNWSGKLLAIIFSLSFYKALRHDWKLSSFINLTPDRGALKRVLWVGGIALISMSLLTIAFSKGKVLNIQRLAYQATMPGLDEELWRGLIIALAFPLIKAERFKMGHPMVWLTTIIFASGHSLFLNDWSFGFALDAFIITGILGYILAWLTLVTKSILPSLLLHNLINFSTNFLEMVVL